MKKKLKALVAMMSLCALGAVGSAFALTREAATASGNAGNYDQAVYLYWGGTASSVDLANCDSLSPNTPVYRYITVSPRSTKTVAGTVTVSFELQQTADTTEKHYSLSGVTIEVFRTQVEAITDSNVSTYAIGANRVASLPSTDPDDLKDTFSVVAGETKHVTAPYYYAIKVVYDGTNLQGKTLGGQLTIRQSFAAA